MQLNWKIVNEDVTAGGDASQIVIYHSEVDESSEPSLKLAVEACIDKAVELLAETVREDSRFMLFGWDPQQSVLSIVVADDKKENDVNTVVRCHFVAIEASLQKLKAESDEAGENQAAMYAESIKDWIRDYLTTCAAFLQFSLVAMFHNGDRRHCELL